MPEKEFLIIFPAFGPAMWKGYVEAGFISAVEKGWGQD